MTSGPGAPVARPERHLRDVLEGRVRITLAGTEYVLPVLTIGQNADWKASLDAELAPVIAPANDLAKVMSLLESLSDRLLEFIYSYDQTGVLPARGEWERGIYPHELLRAVMEVRLATDPSASYALAMARVAPSPTTIRERLRSALTNSWRRPTAGRSGRSGTN